MNKVSQNIISLNGKWNFITDNEMKLQFEDVIKLLKQKDELKKMEIPINWQLAGLNNFSGTVWFIKSFDLPDTKDSMHILKFRGVDYFTDVWLNEKYLGHHEGYFQTFYFNISQAIASKVNLLVVKVTSPKEEPEIVWPLKKKLIKGIFNHHDCRPGAWSFEYGQDLNTGGIWNDVAIESCDKIYVENIRVTPKLNEKRNAATLKVVIDYESNLINPVSDNVVLQVVSPSGEINEKKIQLEFKPGKNQLIFIQTIHQPELWWSWDTGEQNRYQLKLQGKFFEEKQIEFGIRDVMLDEQKQFFINGEKLFLRGSNIIPTQWLSELTKEKAASLVTLMKDANINTVRVHAHVNRNEFYEECDRQGIIVWQDFALQWTYDESEEFAANAVRQIKEMVNQLNNHPSIAFWCCHNEPGDQINSLDPLLYDAVLSEDNSRIIRLASNYEEHPYDGWYWGNKEHYAAAPMGPLVTEFGAQAVPEIKSLQKFLSDDEIYKPDWEKWKYHNFQYEQTFHIAGIEAGKDVNEFIENSQNYQANLIQTAVDFYRRKKFNGINGIFQFMFVDCWPSVTWSVVDYYGEKKSGFYALKNAYQPVYISVRMRQQKYFHGSKLNFDLWIINDMLESFRDISLKVYFDEIRIHQVDYIKLAPNDVQFIDWEKLKLEIPVKTEEGEHQVKFELLDNILGKIISVNSCRILIISEMKVEFKNVQVVRGEV